MNSSTRVSLADIAREVNVSAATVSYVLNGRSSQIISEATREKVLKAARELGYRPNRAAQALAGQRSNLIELCIYGFFPAFYSHVLHEFEKQFVGSPYQLHIVNVSQWSEDDWDNADGGWPVGGIIVFDAELSDRGAEMLRKRGVPLLAAGIYPRTDGDYVKVDIQPALREAMQYLASNARRVAFMTPWTEEDTLTKPDPRYTAYREAMANAGLGEELIMAVDGNGLGDRLTVRENVRDYVAKSGCPDAIFCFNDEMAIATLAALRDLKIRVPEDVILLGCDGIEDTLYHAPAISTIQFPFEQVAQHSMEILRARIENPAAEPRGATLQAELLLRDSTRR